MKARADQEGPGNSTRCHRLQPSEPAWTYKVKPKHFVHVSLSDFQTLSLAPRSNRFLPTGLEGLAGRRGECSPLDVWKGLTLLTRLWTELSPVHIFICQLLLWKVWRRNCPCFPQTQCWVPRQSICWTLQLQSCQFVYSLTVSNYQHCPGNSFSIYYDTDKIGICVILLYGIVPDIRRFCMLYADIKVVFLDRIQWTFGQEVC